MEESPFVDSYKAGDEIQYLYIFINTAMGIQCGLTVKYSKCTLDSSSSSTPSTTLNSKCKHGKQMKELDHILKSNSKNMKWRSNDQ